MSSAILPIKLPFILSCLMNYHPLYFIVVIFGLYILLSLVYSPLVFWSFVLGPAIWIFMPRFFATLVSYFHLRKILRIGIFTICILLFLVCFRMFLILLLIIIDTKFMIALKVVSFDYFPRIMIISQKFL